MCRSSEECHTHYNHYYITHPAPPLQNMFPPTRPLAHKSHDKVSRDTFPTNYPGEEIPHYNPLRADFDIESYNDAEKSLTAATAQIQSDEQQQQGEEEGEREEDCLLRQLVLSLIDSYWWILVEREKRKSVIREHGLITIYKILARERLLPDRELSVRVLMRRYTRFLDIEYTEKLIQSLIYEETLIERVKQLQLYRSLGIRSLTGIKLYERLKEKRIRTRERTRKVLDDMCKSDKQQQQLLIGECDLAPSLNKQKYTSAPLNITYSPGIEQLDVQEREICSTHRILPDVYLRCKNLMLSEYKRTGRLRLMDARKLCRIDVNKTRKIYNFLVSKQLINQPSPSL